MADYVTNFLTLDDGLNIQYLQVGAAPTQGEIEYNGDRDFYAAYLEAGTTYTFEQRGSRTDDGTLTDPRLYRFVNMELEVIDPFANDDGGEGLNSAFSYTPETSQMYYIEGGRFGSLGTGTFEIEVYEGGYAGPGYGGDGDEGPPPPFIDMDGDGVPSYLDPDDNDNLVPNGGDRPGSILGIPEVIFSNDETESYTLTLNDPDGFVYYEGPEIYWRVSGLPEGAGEGERTIIDTGYASETFVFNESLFDQHNTLELGVNYLDAFGDQTITVPLPDLTVGEFSGPPIYNEEAPMDPITNVGPAPGGGSGNVPPPFVAVLEDDPFLDPVAGPRNLVIDTVKPRDFVTDFSPRGAGERIAVIEPDGFDFDELTVKTVSNRRRLKRVARTDADLIYNKKNDKLYWNANGFDKGLTEITDEGLKVGGAIAKIEIADKNQTLKTGMFYGVDSVFEPVNEPVI